MYDVYMITVYELAKHRVVGVVDHFSDRRVILTTKARTLSSTDDCLKVISIRCRTKTIPGTDSVNKFSYSNRLEHNLQCGILHTMTTQRWTQPCIPPGSLNRVPASAGVKAGMSPLPGGKYHCVIPYGMWVPVAVRLACKLLYASLFRPTYFVFLISLVHHHHPALLHHHALIMDRLLTFLMTFSTLVLKASLSQSLSFHSHLSFAQAHLLECDHWSLGVWQSLAVVVLVSVADLASPAGF